MLSRLTWSHYDSGSAHSEDDVALDAAAAAEAQPVGGGTTTGAPGGGSSVAAMALTTSPLHRAALRGHIELVSELLASRAPPTVCDKNHRTPLHYCCCGRDGHRVIAALLLAAGASINAAGISGDTYVARCCCCSPLARAHVAAIDQAAHVGSARGLGAAGRVPARPLGRH